MIVRANPRPHCQRVARRGPGVGVAAGIVANMRVVEVDAAGGVVVVPCGSMHVSEPGQEAENDMSGAKA